MHTHHSFPTRPNLSHRLLAIILMAFVSQLLYSAVSDAPSAVFGQYTFAIERVAQENPDRDKWDLAVSDAHAFPDEILRTPIQLDGEPEAMEVVQGPDGHLSLLLTHRSIGSGAYAWIRLFRFDGERFSEIPLPDLSEDQREAYMGHDRYHLDGSTLYRSFPLYLPHDPNSLPLGGSRILAIKDINAKDSSSLQWQLHPGQ